MAVLFGLFRDALRTERPDIISNCAPESMLVHDGAWKVGSFSSEKHVQALRRCGRFLQDDSPKTADVGKTDAPHRTVDDPSHFLSVPMLSTPR